MTLGKQQTRQQNSDEHTAYTGSVIGTTGGNIRLEAGDDTDVINSDIIAQKDETDANTGNILFKSQAVNITSQNATAANTHSFSQKTSGLTAGVSSSLVSDVQSLDKLTDAAKDTNSRRMTIMAAAAGTSKAYTLTNNLHNKNFGSMRAQATIGSQTTKSDSHSHQEVNDAANVYAEGNLIFDVSGKGADSTVTITGSNITAKQNLYNQVEGSVIYQASTQTSTQDSQNSSKGAGFGVYASANLSTDGLSSNSAGFTINANKAKGSSQEIATTHTNTQITVGGTTVNDIGGSLILDGANLDTTYLTGTVGKDLIVKSRQDTYQYTHDQKQAGFSADVGFDGKPQSFSITGGNTNANASYAQVTDQTGIKAKESTLQVQGKSKFTGGYLITDQGKNHTQFAQGIQTQDIENHLNYEGNAISLGIGIGADTGNPDNKAKPALQGLGYGTITPVNKTSTTHSAITDQAGLSHINTENFKQKEVQNQLNEIITNDFNQAQAHKELNAQVTITQAFDTERRAIRSEFAQKAEDYRNQAKDLADNDPRKTELETKAKQIDDNLRLFDGITSALYAPNSNGIIGDVSRAASPELAYQIGQYFKGNKTLNQLDNGNRPEEQSANHLLAHAVLGAAVSYATGNDITAGAVSAVSNEAGAGILANYLYGTNEPSELNQNQKDIITSILNLATVATNTVVNNGDINIDQMANDLNVGENAVEWNGFNKNKKEPESLRVKKERYREAVDAIVKDTSVEVAAAAGLGVSGSMTYVGDGKVNISGAVVTGWSASASANKSFTQGKKSDGLYVESCASGKMGIGIGACYGASENKRMYVTEKAGVGIGGQVNSAIGYSRTYQVFPTSNKPKQD
ncbi:hemagglutinin repeat-containing protein [Moraxella canis]|uniref:Hemagglutinin repeat-containing protein n=1 Tax=Moraxella canis TaxID=90239 RepID=A0ABZ0WXA2_9GAMM|nr:hemagglutinin repeat-containing protein [Moraxella canis]